MSAWTIYFWVMLDNIRGILDVFAFIFGILFTAMMICYLVSDHEWDGEDCSPQIKSERKRVRQLGKNIFWLFPVLTFFISCITFIPTSKQFAVIYLAPKIINNEQVRDIADDTFQLLKKQMEFWIKEKNEPTIHDTP